MVYLSCLKGSCNCGESNFSKHRRSKRDIETHIYGGKPAAYNEYPWIAHISMGCTGFLVDRNHVITAAHCIERWEKNRTYRKLRAGEVTVTLGTNNKRHPGVKIRVSKIDIHDSWKLWNSFGYFVGRKALQNSVDIAILTLSRRAPRSINPVCLPSHPSNTYVGYDAVVAGYGRVDRDGKKRGGSDQLLQARVKIISNNECGRYGNLWYGIKK